MGNDLVPLGEGEEPRRRVAPLSLQVSGVRIGRMYFPISAAAVVAFCLGAAAMTALGPEALQSFAPPWTGPRLERTFRLGEQLFARCIEGGTAGNAVPAMLFNTESAEMIRLNQRNYYLIREAEDTYVIKNGDWEERARLSYDRRSRAWFIARTNADWPCAKWQLRRGA